MADRYKGLQGLDSGGDGVWVNPLILYVFSELLITVVWVINVDGTALPSYLYEHCLSRIGDGDSGLPSLVYSLLCVGVTWLAGYPLWKRRIYIRL